MIFMLSVSVSNSPSEVEEYYPAIVHRNGNKRLSAPEVLQNTYMLDVTYFPWDQQACQVMFGSWTYTASKVQHILGIYLYFKI